jgi:hypothetical protein
MTVLNYDPFERVGGIHGGKGFGTCVPYREDLRSVRALDGVEAEVSRITGFYIDGLQFSHMGKCQIAATGRKGRGSKSDISDNRHDQR